MNAHSHMSLHNKCKEVINDLHIEWQYPAITELTVYNQQRDNKSYLGLPWATIIDKQLDLPYIYRMITRRIHIKPPTYQYTTSCQHIAYKHLIPLFIQLGITDVYISHKIKGLDVLNGIRLHPLPLYAVNIENNERNTLYKTLTAYSNELEHSTKLSHVDILARKRNYLYSFIGAYDPRWYLTIVRDKIFKIGHPEHTMIKNTKSWHFENIVYGKQVGKWNFSEEEANRNKIKLNIYNQVVSSSRFSLCPSGTGPNSIRFWESLAFGSIPILLADTLELPPHPLWDQAIIRLREMYVGDVNTILSNISSEKENSMRKKCLQIYDDFKDSFIISM